MPRFFLWLKHLCLSYIVEFSDLKLGNLRVHYLNFCLFGPIHQHIMSFVCWSESLKGPPDNNNIWSFFSSVIVFAWYIRLSYRKCVNTLFSNFQGGIQTRYTKKTLENIKNVENHWKLLMLLYPLMTWRIYFEGWSGCFIHVPWFLAKSMVNAHIF